MKRFAQSSVDLLGRWWLQNFLLDVGMNSLRLSDNICVVKPSDVRAMVWLKDRFNKCCNWVGSKQDACAGFLLAESKGSRQLSARWCTAGTAIKTVAERMY